MPRSIFEAKTQLEEIGTAIQTLGERALKGHPELSYEFYPETQELTLTYEREKSIGSYVVKIRTRIIDGIPTFHVAEYGTFKNSVFLSDGNPIKWGIQVFNAIAAVTAALPEPLTSTDDEVFKVVEKVLRLTV